MHEVPESLARNLRALAARDLELAQRLLLPAADGHLRFEAGTPLYRFHKGWLPLEPSAPTPPADHVLWWGVGVGDGLAQALAARPELRVVAWDRDPWMLRQALVRHDWSEALASGRLVLRLGVDALDLPDLPLVEHPVLAQVYGLERHLLGAPAGPRVGLCVGKLFVDDLAAALRRRGHVVVPLDDQGWSAEELELAVRRSAPELIVRVNTTSGLTEFTHAQGLPLVVWEIDPATDRLRAPSTPTDHVHLFTYREANVAPYRELGFTRVTHLPLAAPIERRRPLTLDAATRDQYAAPVAFVGASQVDSAEELGARLDARYAAAHGEAALPGFRAACRDLLDLQARAGAWVLPELFRARFPDFPAGDEDPVQLLGERAAAERRLRAVERLADQGIQVWGDRGFEQARGVVYRGPARHGDELTAIYNAATVNVDVGRLYQRDIVTMRVFDVLACGGFLIAERSPALEELFEVGVEIEAWSTLHELEHKVRHYLAHPEAARAIAERGRAAVLERHSFDRRVDQLLRGALQPA